MSGNVPRTLKILIVEDNGPMRRLLKSICAQANDHVIECATGEEAMLAHEQHRPDWVLMDLSMPGMGGLTTIEQIRARDPTVRIVAVSELPEEEYGAEARSAGAEEYVSKDELLRLQTIMEIPNQS